MHPKSISHRRTFIKQNVLMGLGFGWSIPGLRDPSTSNAGLEFLFPSDGEVIHARDGLFINNAIKIQVSVKAPPGSIVHINTQPAIHKDGIYMTEVSLSRFKNVIELVEKNTGIRKKVTVFWYKNIADKYRVSIDDAIWFLKDIHQNNYQSLFDNPFLGFLKELHDAHGTNVHINLFYETDGFDLSQMTDAFRNEWKANASWLQLSFHARAEFPDNPYKHASYQQVKKDCDAVIKQIRRFAGDESVAAITTLHWGEVPVEVSRALRDAGYALQLCDFNVDDNLAPCSYYLTVDQRRHMNKRFVWHDNKEAITFVKSSIIIDTKKAEEIIPFLDRYERESRKPPYVDLLVHEQYFYEYYHNYQPDYRAKVITAVQWAVDNGYSPAFFDTSFNQ